VGGLALFFERYFGFKRLAARGQDAFALMCNQDEFVLTLMKAKKHDPAAYPETFHVGFYVGAPTPCKPSMMNFRKPAFLRERFSTRAEAAAASPPSIATLRAVS
jgi:hypothetical protein